jgi:alpha-beta hydrolase superfamily lysophospholipase
MPTLTTRDGLSLQIHHWPAAGAHRGTVLLVHGLGEHLGRYAAVIARLQAAGWAVSGYDQRGHGDSPGVRGGIAAVDSLLDDLGRMIDATRAASSGPLVLLGHSMGGLVVGRFVAEGLGESLAAWWRPVDGLVMSSPALDPGMGAMQKALLALLGPLAPNLRLGNGLKPDWISRDPAVVRAYVADPRVHDRVTPRLVRFIVDGGAQVRAAAPSWRLPTALLYAGADRCVAPRGSAAFAAAAPVDVVRTVCYEGLAHEIFNEPERERVLVDLLDWLDARHPATA